MLVAVTRDLSPTFDKCELTHLPRVPIDLDVARRPRENRDLIQDHRGVFDEHAVRKIRRTRQVHQPDSEPLESSSVVLVLPTSHVEGGGVFRLGQQADLR